MKSYKVPQNIRREDQIIGPLTLKQMGIVGAGGGLAYAIYVGLQSRGIGPVFWGPPITIITILTICFAFIKIHNLPFHQYLIHLALFKFLPQKRIWIQGADTPRVSALSIQTKKQETQEKVEEKEKKSIEELSQIVDSYEAEQEAKKEELEKIINQNHK